MLQPLDALCSNKTRWFYFSAKPLLLYFNDKNFSRCNLIASELKLSGCYALADLPVFRLVQIQISRHQTYESRIGGVAQRSPLVEKKQTFRCVFRLASEFYISFFLGVLAKPAQDRHGLKSQNVHKNVCQNFLSYAQKRRFCFEALCSLIFTILCDNLQDRVAVWST